MSEEAVEMRWVVIFTLLLTLAACKRHVNNGMLYDKYVEYEASGYGAHSPVKTVIEYANEDGDTISIGQDPNWVDLPWDHEFTIPEEAKPTLYLYVKTIEIGDSVAAKILINSGIVAQKRGTEVSLTYHP